MREHARIQFSTADVEDEQRFLEGYVFDAAERLPDREDCDMFVFVRAGHGESVEGGLVVVDVYGDPGAVIDRERETWDRLVADGPLAGWERDEVDVVGMLAQEFADVEAHERMRYLASRMSAAALPDLEETPPPVGDAEGDASPVGWYRVPHILANHQGYPLEDEIDGYVENVRMLLKAIARSDAGKAHDLIDDVLADLEATREGIDELGAGETGDPETGDDDGDDEG